MAAKLALVDGGGDKALSKAARFRAMLQRPSLDFIMEAHNGLSARIVEETGFNGIWASGLSMSAALGVRDNNEASWTQVLEVLEFMSDATSVPILVDGDTGYGNFNNMRRLVAKLEQRGIAAVCIEDKLFPKTNSFLGSAQPLADIDEFCGKIKAGKDSQRDDDFSIVARVEALISGWGLDEALRRAAAYHEAGADAILIHSKIAEPDEIFAFTKEWDNRSPVVIVPTMYYATPTQQFRDHDISLIIWANHNMRVAIQAMRDLSREIFETESLVGAEGRISSVKEVFELTGNEELAAAEERYLPTQDAGYKAVVLAASRGAALGSLTDDKPKCMIDVRGQPLLRRQIAMLNGAGVQDVTIVRGYKKEAIDLPSVGVRDNDEYADTRELYSMACARDVLEGPCLVTYGDILFRPYMLDALLRADGDIVIVADALWREREQSSEGLVRDLVVGDRAFSTDFLDDAPVYLTGAGPDTSPEDATGEWVGMLKLSDAGAAAARAELDAMDADGSLRSAEIPDLLIRLIASGHKVQVQYITGQWLDIDDALDLARARNIL
ncbi:MAG: phosphoenolpyruvate mutase [Rhodospirillaceae bacterium]|nr:phosphoenolpyruvate mutase [Rhodospirillaceae bacterium]MBT5809542.1 phosphoenolpyruvate mutase [Rhodospirillaceae bacterium]